MKVLDFGLAKVLEPIGPSPDLSQSPTITTPAMTQRGVILGTASYMSPEQAKGRAADKRSDLWAFGCVLYEMLTGRRAFEGEDVSDTLAAVLRGEPDWNALGPDVPISIRTLLRACVEKDRRKRPADASAVLFVLDHVDNLVAAGGGGSAANDPTLAERDDAYILKEAAAAQTEAAVVNTRREMTRSSRRRVALVSVLASLLVAVIAIGGVWLGTRPDPQRVVRTAIITSGPESYTSGLAQGLAITPDGSRVVYRGRGVLVVRALDQLEPTVLTGFVGLVGMCISPDGQWVGFGEANALRKVAISGGSPVTVARIDGNIRGATWGSDDAIVYATVNTTTGLQRVSAAGGDPVVLTKPDRDRGELDHWWPELLPGGNAVLFTIIPQSGRAENADLAVLDLQTNTSKVLLAGGRDAHYVPTGHLLFNGGDGLRAVGFDPVRLELIGTPVPVAEQVATTALLAMEAAVASNGTLVYVPRGAFAGSRQFGTPRSVVWVDRQGRETPIPLPPRTYTYPRLSPDGTRVIFDIRDDQNDLWLWEVSRPALTRLTFDPSTDYYPVWTPDGRRAMFFSAGSGGNIFSQLADGTGAVEQLTAGSTTPHYPYSISPDGQSLVFQDTRPGTGTDLSLLTLPARSGPRSQRPAEPVQGPKGDVRPLIHRPFVEANAEISPDGRWIAYQSNESGRDEIHVRPFPNVDDGHWQVSTGGGTRPLWARSGRELFYLDEDNLLTAVTVQTTSTFSATDPVTLLKTAYYSGFGGGGQVVSGRTYDVSPDGQRFLMIKDTAAADQTQTSLVVVQNWTEELKRLVPTR